MTRATEFNTDWHLERSWPANILTYRDPARPFIGQINRLVARFRCVQFLCEHDEPAQKLTELRNALAFHVVKMSRWWNFDFCPRGVLEIRAPLFLSYVRAHLERSLEDETLYDVFTLQRHMRAGDRDHVVILGQDKTCDGETVFYGVDGKRRFRFGSEDSRGTVVWDDSSYADFPGLWLAARSDAARIANDPVSGRDLNLAQAEHRQSSFWHQQYFHAACEQNTVQRYIEARAQLNGHQSAFGRIESESIINCLAFRIVRLAVHSHRPVSELLNGQGQTRMERCAAVMVERRARTHVFTCADETQQAALMAIVDRLENYRPRQCF
ncbi:hypothetical protein [Acetobacter oeni]|uniref:Uncharacterized protein n=1 Tax=Acetobacter oeni TaxID=304077 RepID=A0A511XHT5_9PROT|nr:hypothetical protein [Acetobacter oeni]MBB3882547.1 hypothetical protein [Acetobacter oeni]NHO18641.1 hypothetical protein [Acetobacter oeni]GBR11921.1 hypothetical protein AA21952_3496 [Acetobacter oeni LMG 21952]GEN62515.1 hypothetical protein AOE01nite_07390 [Acetobacter oeni]